MIDTRFRTDLPDREHFVGRAREIDELFSAMTEGVNSIAAVMGGRGMGKSSLLRRVELELKLKEQPVRIVRIDTPGSASAMLTSLASALQMEVKPYALEEGLREALKANGQPIGILLDEIESLLADREGVDLLNNLRSAYENLSGRLRVVVFGGTGLRLLLQDKVSPFLRTCRRWCTLRGLSLEEVNDLLRVPGAPSLPPASLGVLWEQTNGHPLLLRDMFTRVIVESTRTGKLPELVVPDVLRAMELDECLRALIFPMWWDNLQEEGQRMYRRLLRCKTPVRRAERARQLGPMPDVWVPVLESTGVARVDGDEVLPRGELFRTWVLENIPEEEPPPPPQVSFLAPGADNFEQQVITAVAKWIRDVREFPLFAIRADLKSSHGNERLQLEAHFQLGLLLALRQRPEWTVEPEPLSGGYELYTDIKVRERGVSDGRACIECKIWGRNHKNVVQQAMDYAVPSDTFAVVVMVDRHQRPLGPEYRKECLGGALEIFPPQGSAPSEDLTPAIVTKHQRSSGKAFHVYHFLLQLPPG